MAQNIDIRFQEKAKSEPLNKRFRDITGPSVLQGFRLQKGSTDFSVSLVRGGFNTSIAVTPSGASVSETTDLIDRISVFPNTDLSGSPRVDSLYLRYQFGTFDATAEYVIVSGENGPAQNPNVQTHLLLGYIYVYPNNQALRPGDFISVPYGFHSLEIAGESMFHGDAEFEKKVIFRGPVEFLGGGGGGSDIPATFIERLPAPYIAAQGQREFTLPSSYSMNTHTLFVYKNGMLVPPSEWLEVSNTKFSFHDPLETGDRIWAFWYRGVSVYTPAEHNHDDLYYRKYEIANRSVRYASDFFAGTNGRVVPHFLGNTEYIVISVIPTERANNIGEVTVEKRDNEIVVYNSGANRGKFDITYMIKAPYDENPGTGLQYKDFNIESSDFDSLSGLYTIARYRRKDGTRHIQTTLLNPNASGQFTRLRVEEFNGTGTEVIDTKLWALTYDDFGNIKNKTLTV